MSGLIISPLTPDGGLVGTSSGTLVSGTDGTNAHILKTDATGVLLVSGGGGGGGGAVTIADGADVAEGATSAAVYTDGTGAAAGTLVALNKGQYVLTAALSAKLPSSLGIKTSALSLSVTPASDAVFTLGAGSALVGKVGIDQTTPGTTNAVSATNFPSTVATGTGAQGATVPRVTVATDSATVAGSATLPAGTNLIGKVGIDQTTAGTTNLVAASAQYLTTPSALTTTNYAPMLLDGSGNLRIRMAGSLVSGADAISNAVMISALSANASDSSTTARPLLTATTIYNGSTWDRQVKAVSCNRIVSAAATTNATSAKASAGNLFQILGYNSNAALRYLKIYNKASAPTVGTDTPILTIVLPPNAPFAFDFYPMYFSTGIAYAMTTGGADADTGALTAGDIVGLNISYT